MGRRVWGPEWGSEVCPLFRLRDGVYWNKNGNERESEKEQFGVRCAETLGRGPRTQGS